MKAHRNLSIINKIKESMHNKALIRKTFEEILHTEKTHKNIQKVA